MTNTKLQDSNIRIYVKHKNTGILGKPHISNNWNPIQDAKLAWSNNKSQINNKLCSNDCTPRGERPIEKAKKKKKKDGSIKTRRNKYTERRE